jgi:hypothetical protein
LAKAPWLEGQIENIIADQDPPRDLDELIDRARGGAVPGYDRHHIVEQGPQNGDLSQQQLQSPENIALVPKYKHWRITEYYQKPQEELGGLSPREFLRDKSRGALSVRARCSSEIRGLEMKKDDWTRQSIQDLIAAYLDVSLREAEAVERGETAKVRRLFDERMQLDRSIRARGLQARKSLIPLLEHRNAQVRLNTAKHLLAVAPNEARATLEDLAAHGPSQQRGDAGMCFWYMEKGIFKPT